MLAQQYRQVISSRLLDLAEERYPNNPRLQMIYQIGFLQAQLADAMHRDSYVAEAFRTSTRQAWDLGQAL
jgi:hypothetical protein